MKPFPISTAILVVSLFLVPTLLAQSPDSANQGAASPAASAAEVPRLIKFSGTLLDAQDRPMAGPVGVTFALHAQQTGGAALWIETQNVTPDAHGNYTVLLGANSANGVPAELFASGEARWLEVQVERQVEQPRILLVSVPYALKAKDAETLGGRPASAFVTTETLAGNSAGAAAASSSSTALPKSIATTPRKAASPQAVTPCSSVTSDGTAAVNSLALFTTACKIQSSLMTQAVVNGFPGVNLAGNNAGLLLSGTGTHEVTVTGSTSSGRLGQDAQGFFFASDTPGEVIKFDTNNGTLNEWMRITSAGNVGIGTQTPAAKLDVASAATAGDLLRIAGPTGGLRVQSNGSSPNVVAGFSGNTVGTRGGDTVSGGGQGGAINSAANTDITVGVGVNTVGGGGGNTASNGAATVSGGWRNTASNGFAAVGGGEFNVASGLFATVGGGFENTASGQLATVSGGNSNTAQGSSSFAAGQFAQAMHNGTFVWGDGTATGHFTSTAPDQFLIHASGGVGIGTPSPSHQLEVVDAGSSGLRVQTNTTGGTVASFGGNGDFQIDAPGVLGGRFVVKEGGLVGIGTSGPAAVLEVSGSQPVAQAGNGTDANRVLQIAGGQGGNTTGGTGQVAGIGAPVILIAGDGGDAPGGSLNGNGGTVTIAGGRAGGGAGAPGSPGNVILAPPGSGLVGIGTNTPDNYLTVNGSADKPGGGSWGTFSDGRLKNVRGSFDSGLKQVLQLHPIRYQYKERNALGIHDSEEHIGVVAQDVARVLPEAVSADGQGYLLVNNDPILWSMLNAIKEQQTLITRQQEQLQVQRAEIGQLASQVKLMQASLRGTHQSSAVRTTKTHMHTGHARITNMIPAAQTTGK